MKKHNENCEGCISTEGEDVCFDDLTEMMSYHRAQRPWYEVIWESIYNPCWRAVDKIRYFPKEVKWFWQRGTRGWSDQDAWSVYDHLNEIIPPMLRQMSKNSHGYPVAMYEDSNKHEHTAEESDAAKRKWDYTLNTIIYAFEIEKGISNLDILDLGPRPTKKQKGFGKKHCEQFDVKLLTKEDRKMRKEGWKNFQKYFHNLWD